MPANLCVLQAHCWSLSVFCRGIPGCSPVCSSPRTCSLTIKQRLTRSRTRNLHLINGRLQLTNKALQIIEFCRLPTLTVAMSIGCDRRRAPATLRRLMAKMPAVVAAAMKQRCNSQLHWHKTRMHALLNSYWYSYCLFCPTLVSVSCSSKCRSHLLCNLHGRLQIYWSLCTHPSLH